MSDNVNEENGIGDEEYGAPSPQDRINGYREVVVKGKDALAELTEEALEEQEKLNSDLTMERDALKARVEELETQLAQANEKIRSFEEQKLSESPQSQQPSSETSTPLQTSLLPPISVPVRQDDAEEYPLLIPTPSGNNTTVLVDDAQLEHMKQEMLKQMKELTREEVARMIDNQDSLRWAAAAASTKSRDEKPIEENPIIVVDEHVASNQDVGDAASSALTQSRPEVELNETSSSLNDGTLSIGGSDSNNMLHPTSGRKKKNLFRSGSYTEWSPDMLEGLKSEMLESLREMRREELSKMLTSQDQLRWGSEAKDDDTDVASVASELEKDERLAAPGQDKRIRGKNLLRNGSKWDWSDVALDALKTEMYEELTRIHKKELADMIAQQDAIRFPQGAGSDDGDNSMSRETSTQRRMMALGEMEMKQMHDAIVEEMTHITKRELSSMMEKQMQLRWGQTSGTAAQNPPQNQKTLQAVQTLPRDSDNNLFRQSSQERWDLTNMDRMRTEMADEIGKMQRKELQRRFERSANLIWTSEAAAAAAAAPVTDNESEMKEDRPSSKDSGAQRVVSHAVQTSRTHITLDEPDLLMDGAVDTPGGPLDDDLSALNYVAPVTSESVGTSDQKKTQPQQQPYQPAVPEKKEYFDDEDELLLSGKPTPGATIASLPGPEEYTTPGGPDDEEETPGGDFDTPMGPQEPQVIIRVAPLTEHPDFTEYKTQSENTIRGLQQEMAALVSKHEEEIAQFQESKMQLILSTSAEMDALRQMIRQMADNFREIQTQAALLRS